MTLQSALIAALLFVSASLTGCVTWPSSMSRDEPFLFLIKTARLPKSQPWVSRSAEHTWFDYKTDQGWTRIEVISKHSGVAVHSILSSNGYSNERWTRNVHVVAHYRGQKARAFAEQLHEIAPEYPFEDSYQAWPGPNSNTFVEWCCAEIDGLHAELYPNAVGKDHTKWIDVGLSNTGTGVELHTYLLALQLGLNEGVEVSLLGLTLGVALWPPRLKLPLLPDRIF